MNDKHVRNHSKPILKKTWLKKTCQNCELFKPAYISFYVVLPNQDYFKLYTHFTCQTAWDHFFHSTVGLDRKVWQYLTLSAINSEWINFPRNYKILHYYTVTKYDENGSWRSNYGLYMNSEYDFVFYISMSWIMIRICTSHSKDTGGSLRRKRHV